MRVAALTSDGTGRTDAKAVVERAMALERELWSGEPASTSGGMGPSEIAAEVEDLLRTILRRGVAGELGSDFRTAADEALLADGLAIGEGAGAEGLGGDTEWDMEPVLAVDSEPERRDIQIEAEVTPGRTGEPEVEPEGVDRPFDMEEPGEIRVSRGPGESRLKEHPTVAFTLGEELDAIGSDGVLEPEAEEPGFGREPSTQSDWLSAEGDVTMDFPARSAHLRDLARSPMDRDEVKARVNYLFPRTETDWTVGSRAPRRAAS